MHVIYIHQYFTTRSGASGTRSYEFSRYLIKQGHHVTIITGVSDLSDMKTERLIERRDVDGIDVIIINTRYSNYMECLRRLLAFFSFLVLASIIGLRLKKPDIVFATSTPLTVGIPGYIISRLKRAYFIFEVRDLWPEAPIQLGVLTNPILIKMARLLERFLCRRAKKIIALSPGMKKSLIRTGIKKEKVEMIPNCSDLDLFHPGVHNTYFQDKYHLNDKFIVSYFGAMGDANGLDFIVEGALELKERDESSIVFVLAGDGSQRRSLELFCQEHNLDNVIFTGSIPRREVPKLVAASNLCLVIFKNVPVLRTNCPNKLFDALAAGKPVLVNFTGWIKELLEEHNAGIYVNPDDSKAMADILLKLRSTPGWCSKMGQNARKLAEKRFDRVKLAQELERVFYKATGNE